jgi:hypothetical protein
VQISNGIAKYLFLKAKPQSKVLCCGFAIIIAFYP